MSSIEQSALECKSAGNAAHQAEDYRKAIYHFSKGVELSPGPPTNYLLYSNRSASYTLLEDYESALADAEIVIQLKPEWPKGYSRKGAALQHLKRFREAITAYEQGLKLDPESEPIRKGLEEAQQAKLIHEPKPLDKNVSQPTKQKIDRVKMMQQLGDVVWHLEILKDKIWLADPPKAPFRPRSLFLIDSSRVQMLHMSAHPTRDSISLDELLDFIVNTCFKHSIIPGTIEFSDHKLQIVLQDMLKEMGISTRTSELGPTKSKFFEDTIKSFEDKEMEQWKDNPKFTGVLRQRAQKGLMSVPSTSHFFLKFLLASAGHFYRSKAYLYYTKALGIRIEPSTETQVALITRNTSGQYGVAMSTIAASKLQSDCGTQCFLFSDASNIPFDDADLIERNGWDISEERFPLPLVYSADHNADMQRPPLEDLKWYEITFRAISLFVSNTFKKPTFMQVTPLCYRCNVHTHSGRVSVIVTAPPSEDAAIQHTLEEPTPSPPKDQPLHEPLPLPPPPEMGVVCGEHHTPAPAAPAPVPKCSTQSTPAPSSLPQLDVSANGNVTAPQPQQPPLPTLQHQQPQEFAPHGSPPATLATAASHTPHTVSKGVLGGGFGSPCSSTPVPPPTIATLHSSSAGSASSVSSQAGVFAESSEHKWRQEKTKLEQLRQLWKSEHVQKENLLRSLTTIVLSNDEVGTGGDKKWKHDKDKYEREIAELKMGLHDKEEKIKWQADHMKAQEVLVTQLQERVKTLETTNTKLVKEYENKSKADAHETRQLLTQMASRQAMLMHALTAEEEAAAAAADRHQLSSGNTTNTPGPVIGSPTSAPSTVGLGGLSTPPHHITKGKPPEGPNNTLRNQRVKQRSGSTPNNERVTVRDHDKMNSSTSSTTSVDGATTSARSANRHASDLATAAPKKRGIRAGTHNSLRDGREGGMRQATASPTRYQRTNSGVSTPVNSDHYTPAPAAAAVPVIHHPAPSGGAANNNNPHCTPLRTPSPAVSIASTGTPSSSRSKSHLHSARAGTPTAHSTAHHETVLKASHGEVSNKEAAANSTAATARDTYDITQPPPAYTPNTDNPVVYTTPPTTYYQGYGRRTSFPVSGTGPSRPVPETAQLTPTSTTNTNNTAATTTPAPSHNTSTPTPAQPGNTTSTGTHIPSGQNTATNKTPTKDLSTGSNTTGSSNNPTREGTTTPTTTPYGAVQISTFQSNPFLPTPPTTATSGHLTPTWGYGASQPTSYRSRSPQDLSEQEYLSEANMCF